VVASPPRALAVTAPQKRITSKPRIKSYGQLKEQNRPRTKRMHHTRALTVDALKPGSPDRSLQYSQMESMQWVRMLLPAEMAKA